MKTRMSADFGGNRSVADLSIRLLEFWDNQMSLLAARSSDPILVTVALQILKSVPSVAARLLRERMSFERALEAAENYHHTIKRGLAQKGGRALKEDSLQRLIMSIVQHTPNVTTKLLLRALEREPPGRVIKHIGNELIEFSDDNGIVQTAPISGLKDRLSRAKKKLSIAR